MCPLKPRLRSTCGCRPRSCVRHRDGALVAEPFGSRGAPRGRGRDPRAARLRLRSARWPRPRLPCPLSVRRPWYGAEAPLRAGWLPPRRCSQGCGSARSEERKGNRKSTKLGRRDGGAPRRGRAEGSAGAAERSGPASPCPRDPEGPRRASVSPRSAFPSAFPSAAARRQVSPARAPGAGPRSARGPTAAAFRTARGGRARGGGHGRGRAQRASRAAQ